MRWLSFTVSTLHNMDIMFSSYTFRSMSASPKQPDIQEHMQERDVVLLSNCPNEVFQFHSCVLFCEHRGTILHQRVQHIFKKCCCLGLSNLIKTKSRASWKMHKPTKTCQWIFKSMMRKKSYPHFSRLFKIKGGHRNTTKKAFWSYAVAVPAAAQA